MIKKEEIRRSLLLIGEFYEEWKLMVSVKTITV